jgi:hypothetical protein
MLLPFSIPLKMNDIILFILTVAITILLIILLYQFKLLVVPQEKLPRKAAWEYFKQEAKTGDILLLAYDSLKANIVKVFTNSNWNHVVLVQRKNDEIFMIELAHYSGSDYHHLCVIPLDDWIERNNGVVKIWGRINTPVSNRKLDRVVQSTKKVKLANSLLTWSKALMKRGYQGYKPEMFCNEFIVYVLQELGLCSKRHDASSYKPKDFLLGRIPLKQARFRKWSHLP